MLKVVACQEWARQLQATRALPPGHCPRSPTQTRGSTAQSDQEMTEEEMIEAAIQRSLRET